VGVIDSVAVGRRVWVGAGTSVGVAGISSDGSENVHAASRMENEKTGKSFLVFMSNQFYCPFH
jgi:hypothetical protein